MTEQMDNVEFLRNFENYYRKATRVLEWEATANAFAHCAEEIEAARKAKAVPADVAGLVKRDCLNGNVRALLRYCDFPNCDCNPSISAREIESLTPPVDGARYDNLLDALARHKDALQKVHRDLHEIQDNFDASVYLYARPQSAPTPASQEPCRAMPGIEPALHRPGCEHDDAVLREVAQDIVEMARERDSVTSELSLDTDEAVSNAIIALRRLIPSPAGEGYVLVPVQLTEEMIQSVISWWPSAREIWTRLLAARPTNPTASSTRATGELIHLIARHVNIWQHRENTMPTCGDIRILAGEIGGLGTDANASSAGMRVIDETTDAVVIDEIVTRLYRRFKDWHMRGFGPEDVTWCEVRADVLEIIRALALAPSNRGEK